MAWNEIIDSLLAINGNGNAFIKHLLTRIEADESTGETEEGKEIIKLTIPNKFLCNQVRDLFEASLMGEYKRLGRDVIFHYGIKISPKETKGKDEDVALKTKASQAQLPLPLPKAPLNNGMTFGNFVQGPCNSFAVCCAKELIGGKDEIKLLLLYGPPGVGKTHLLWAIWTAAMADRKFGRVLYVPAATFTNDFVALSKSKAYDGFYRKYNEARILLLDGVSFLGGKTKTQEAFLEILRERLRRGFATVLTSLLPPKDLSGFSKELKSLLTESLLGGLQPPDKETKTRILTFRAAECKLAFPEPVISFWAERMDGDIHQMIGLIKSLRMLEQHVPGEVKDLKWAARVAAPYVNLETTLTGDWIKTFVANYFKADPALISSKSQKGYHVFMRALVIYLCRKLTGMTLEEIGEIVSRNHSTVMSTLEKIETLKKKGGKEARIIEFLEAKAREF